MKAQWEAQEENIISFKEISSKCFGKSGNRFLGQNEIEKVMSIKIKSILKELDCVILLFRGTK